MRKSFLIIVVIIVMCFTLVGCGDNNQKPNEMQPVVKDPNAWENNEYTSIVPVTTMEIKDRKDIENGRIIEFASTTTLEDIKLYAEDLENDGYGVDITKKDEENEFRFEAKNGASYHVVLVYTADVGASLTITK